MAANKGFSKKIEIIAYHDLNEKPAFQMGMQEETDRYYLYTASYRAMFTAMAVIHAPAWPVAFIFGMFEPTQKIPNYFLTGRVMGKREVSIAFLSRRAL